MSPFRIELGLAEALGLFLVLEKSGSDAKSDEVLEALRAYLYAHLSIEDMENPERLYEDLKIQGLPSGSSRRRNP